MMEVLNGLEILCWGDGLFLWRVLNALAMLSGSGNLATLALIGCLFGLIIACVRAIMTGGREFPIVSVFLGAILYAALFAPTTRVIIVPLNITVDRSNISDPNMTPAPGAMVVDHVPLGAALTGYIMSQFGVQLTSMFETAFSTPQSIGVTNGGLAKNLSYITAVRLLAEPYLPSVPSAEAGASAEAFYNWRRSLSAYIHDCTVSGLNSNHVNKPKPADVFTNQDPLAGIKFDAPTWHTVSYGADGTESRVSCTAAHGVLATNAEARLSGAMNQLMTARYGVATNQGVQALQDSLGSIGAHASTDVQKYMQASVVNALWNDALLDGPRLSADVTGIIALRQAEEQRTSDWVGGANLFLSSLRPVLAFFEALTYAVAPFLVFMLGLGERGWKVVGSYFMLALWVQLWLPLLAVSNLFLMTGMEHVAAGLGSQGTSVVDMNTLHTQALHWLGIGALFVQTTPFLALAVLYGGAYTATALAGRMTGQDYYNEKIQAPDAVQPAPVLQMGSMHGHTPGEGTTRTGVPMPTFTPSEQASSVRASQFTEREAAGRNFLAQGQALTQKIAAWNKSATVSNLFTDTDGAGGGTGGSTSLDHGHGGTQTTAAGSDSTHEDSTTQFNKAGTVYGASAGGSVDATVPNIPLSKPPLNDGSLSKEAMKELQRMAPRGSASGHGSFNLGASGGQGADHGVKTGSGGSMGSRAARDNSVKATEQDSSSWDRARRMADVAQALVGQGGSSGLSAAESATLQQMVSDVRTTERAFTETLSNTSGLTAGQNVSAGAAGERYLTKVDADLARAGMELVKSSALLGTFNTTYDGLDAISDVEQRRAAAAFMVLGGLGSGGDSPPLSQGLEERRAQLFSAIASTVFGGSSAASYAPVNADANAGLRDTSVRHGNAQGLVEPRVSVPAGDAFDTDAAAARAGAAGVQTHAQAVVDGGQDNLGTFAAEEQQRIGKEAQEQALAAKQEAQRNLMDEQARVADNILESAQPQTMTAKAGEALNNAVDATVNTVKDWVGATDEK